MSPFLLGLILLGVGLAGVFFGYRIFRVILPILGGVAGYLIAVALFPNSWFLALVVGFVLAVLLALIAYFLWSVMITISGVFMGAALGAAIAHGINLWSWLAWILIIGLAILGGILVWKIRDEVVIILTALDGAALAASGLRLWFGEGTIRSFLWWVIFLVLAIVGILWQWRRYRHLNLLGMGGPAEMPAATRTVPVVETGVPPAAVVTEPPAEEPVVPVPEVVAPVVETASEEQVAAEEPEAPEVVVEQPAVGVLDQLEDILEAADLGNLQEKVEFVEGIGPVFAGKLNEAGIDTVMDLLRRGATRKGRAELVDATGIRADLILKWVNHADLFRVKGVGKQFGELLEAAGVDTVPELAQRNPVNLFNKLSEVNAEKKLVGRAPHQAEVEEWVTQAKSLPRVIEY